MFPFFHNNKNSGLNPLLWAAILGLGIFIYYPLHTAGFLLFDDDWSIYNNPYVTSFNIINCFRYIYYFDYVPISTFYFSLVNRIFGMDPFYFHLLNVIFHMLNGILVYLLCRRVFNLSTLVAHIAAALFVIHPMHVESVAWATEAKDILSVFFLLLSWLTLKRSLRNNEIQRPVYLLSLVLFFLSLGSKTITITFPLLFLLHHYLTGEKGSRKKVFLVLIPFFGLSLGFGLLRIYAVTGEMRLLKNGLGSLEIVENTIIKLVFYFSRSIFPNHLAGFYENGVFHLFWYEYLIVACFGILLIAVYRLSSGQHEKPYYCYLPLFTIIALFPTLKIIPWMVNFVVADRYIYFPSVGLYTLFAILLGKLLALRRFRILALCYVILLTVQLTISARQRVYVWHNDYNLWTDVLEKYPDTMKGLHNLSVQYLKRRDFEKALVLQERLLKLNPGNIKNRVNMVSPRVGGDIDETIRQVEELERNVTVNMSLARTLSILYFNRKEYEKAASRMLVVLHFDPTHMQTHQLLNHINQQLEDPKIYRFQKKLLEEYNLSFRLDPVRKDGESLSEAVD